MPVSRESARTSSNPVALDSRAEDNLRFIRDAMANAGAFTSVSGAGMIAAGTVGLAATVVAPAMIIGTDPQEFLVVWISAAVLSGALSWFAIRRKAMRAGQSLVTGPARRFALAFAPGIVAGAVLTAAFTFTGLISFLPAMWLLLYGASVTAGGALSVKPVPVMGMLFMALGAASLLVPLVVQSILLGAGFGALHLAFGYHITRHYGG
jgi:hypothetical protein